MDAACAARAGASAHAFTDSLDEEVVVSGSDGHHLERVRRLRRVESVTLADGCGMWRSYRVVEAGRGRLRLIATGGPVAEPPLEPGLAVAFALTKGVKPELVVQKLTELGVDRVVPVEAARSVARWRGDRARAALERLRRVAREAAAQCRRARLPEVKAPVSLDVIVRHPALVLADPAGQSIGELSLPDGGEWLLVVGPEGGFSESERAMLSGGTRLCLGRYVLRAETAAVAGAALLAARRSVGA